jgi:hypothetical protein
VARQQGATDSEINEVVTIAMTIGAHKIRLMAEKGQSTVGKTDVPESGNVEEKSGPT